MCDKQMSDLPQKNSHKVLFYKLIINLFIDIITLSHMLVTRSWPLRIISVKLCVLKVDVMPLLILG